MADFDVQALLSNKSEQKLELAGWKLESKLFTAEVILFQEEKDH